ncbi:hypothetical protein DMUE_1509 [Dictyocoela muelleri]|nr:hypothetical protein DMUE_1509 [Dictyocoela muelleri]
MLTVYYMFLRGLSVSDYNIFSELDRHTVYRILKKLENFDILNKYYCNFTPIEGEGLIVGVDKSKFGRRKYHRCHRVERFWVIGAVERSCNRRIILKACEERSSEVLIYFLEKYVNHDSIIYTDCWKGYSKVKDSFREH